MIAQLVQVSQYWVEATIVKQSRSLLHVRAKGYITHSTLVLRGRNLNKFFLHLHRKWEWMHFRKKNYIYLFEWLTFISIYFLSQLYVKITITAAIKTRLLQNIMQTSFPSRTKENHSMSNSKTRVSTCAMCFSCVKITSTCYLAYGTIFKGIYYQTLFLYYIDKKIS